MKLKTLAALLIVALPIGVIAQSHMINKSSGILKVLEVNHVVFEQNSTGSIEIMLEQDGHQTNERAEGLKLLSPLGLEDNTGLGLNVTDEDGATVVRQLSKNADRQYLVKVPKGVSIHYEHTSHAGEQLILKDLSNDIDISVQFNDIRLENISGPVAVSTVHGNIDAIFGNIDQSNAISLTSVHGDVDVTVPNTAKATFHMNTQWGEIYTNLDLDIAQDGDMKKVSSNSMIGKFNGGGVDFKIKSGHSDIYLRKS